MKTLVKKMSRRTVMRVAAILALVGLLIVSGTSCKWTIGVIKGSGDIISEERDVSGFNEIHFSGMGDLIIEQGDIEALTIEADDNIIDLIETEVSGEQLEIGLRRGINIVPTTRIKMYLTVKDLDRISLSGLGDIDCSSFKTDELRFSISGSGNVDFNIEADSLETEVSGLGDIYLKGKAGSHEIDISGSGKYDAKELESNDCRIKVSGLGSATVNVSDNLDIDISGAGNVYYVGQPSITQHISGLGKIRSLD